MPRYKSTCIYIRVSILYEVFYAAVYHSSYYTYLHVCMRVSAYFYCSVLSYIHTTMYIRAKPKALVMDDTSLAVRKTWMKQTVLKEESNDDDVGQHCAALYIVFGQTTLSKCRRSAKLLFRRSFCWKEKNSTRNDCCSRCQPTHSRTTAHVLLAVWHVDSRSQLADIVCTTRELSPFIVGERRVALGVGLERKYAEHLLE